MGSSPSFLLQCCCPALIFIILNPNFSHALSFFVCLFHPGEQIWPWPIPRWRGPISGSRLSQGSSLGLMGHSCAQHPPGSLGLLQSSMKSPPGGRGALGPRSRLWKNPTPASRECVCAGEIDIIHVRVFISIWTNQYVGHRSRVNTRTIVWSSVWGQNLEGKTEHHRSKAGHSDPEALCHFFHIQ